MTSTTSETKKTRGQKRAALTSDVAEVTNVLGRADITSFYPENFVMTYQAPSQGSLRQVRMYFAPPPPPPSPPYSVFFSSCPALRYYGQRLFSGFLRVLACLLPGLSLSLSLLLKGSQKF